MGRHVGKSTDPMRACGTKQGHKTKQTALDHLASNRKANNPVADAGSLAPYICPHCKLWHIGHPIGLRRSRSKPWQTRPSRREREESDEDLGDEVDEELEVSELGVTTW
jgi:hypothetical protein